VNRLTLLAALGILLSQPAAPDARRSVRCTGRTTALHSFLVQVPRQFGSGGQLTLLQIVENGAHVKPGDLIAEFDSTDQLKQAREATAKFDDLSHQVDQKRAEQKSNAEKRNSDLIRAQADLDKAQIDIKKGPVLSDLDQQKNQGEAGRCPRARSQPAALEPLPRTSGSR